VIKLTIVEKNVTSTFKFKTRELMLHTLNNVLKDCPLTNTLVFSVTEVK